MLVREPGYYKLLEIIYEYFGFVEKLALPTSIMDYVHEKIEKGIIPDYWRDWQYLGWTWYSWTMDGQIQELIEKGILEKTCTDDGRLCGLIKLSNKNGIPRKNLILYN